MTDEGFMDPKIWVWAGLIGPSVYIWLELQEAGWSIFIPIGLAAYGLYLLNEKYIKKSQVRREKPNVPGPQEPYNPPHQPEWQFELDRETGQMVPRQNTERQMARSYGRPQQFQPYGGNQQ